MGTKQVTDTQGRPVPSPFFPDLFYLFILFFFILFIFFFFRRVPNKSQIPRAVESQLGPWSDLSGRALGGLGAQPPRKFSVTTPFSLLENEGNAPFMTNY